jgi:hypothetical protein
MSPRTRGKGLSKQIWIPFRARPGGRWHDYWRWRLGMYLYRSRPALWDWAKRLCRFLKELERSR